MIRFLLILFLLFMAYEAGTALLASSYEPNSVPRAIVAEAGNATLRLPTPLTPLVETVVAQRRRCMSANPALTSMHSCSSLYFNELMAMAEQVVESVPNRVGFIGCARKCPSVAALCDGVREINESPAVAGPATNEAPPTELLNLPHPCINLEAVCLEGCLDKYWRGAYGPGPKTLERF